MSEENLLMSILYELKKLTAENKLWVIEDVANYFQMSRSTVSKKIITQNDFPKPISIQNTLPRWKPEEVKRWAERQRN
jgi:predicted DNA-binding transcriptional regulator AlpA